MCGINWPSRQEIKIKTHIYSLSYYLTTWKNTALDVEYDVKRFKKWILFLVCQEKHIINTFLYDK